MTNTSIKLIEPSEHNLSDESLHNNNVLYFLKCILCTLNMFWTFIRWTCIFQCSTIYLHSLDHDCYKKNEILMLSCGIYDFSILNSTMLHFFFLLLPSNKEWYLWLVESWLMISLKKRRPNCYHYPQWLRKCRWGILRSFYSCIVTWLWIIGIGSFVWLILFG